MPTSSDFDLLLLRYLRGDRTSATTDAVRQWVATHPDMETALHALEVAHHPIDGVAYDEHERQHAWMLLSTRLKHDSAAKDERTALRRSSRTLGPFSGRWIAMTITAAVAVLVTVTHQWTRLTTTWAPNASRVYTTRIAQRADITLPDGSRMTLGPSTHARFTEDRRGARTVELDGQAYFSVTHDKTRPFTVRTGAITTRVLGTSFGVRRYASDDVVQVAVVEGKVATQGRGAPLVLTEGTVGHVTDSTATLSPADDARAATAWTRGRLAFTDTPVPVLLRTVGRWYGYELRVSDSTIAALQVTTILSIDDPDRTLETIRELLQVDMTFTSNNVVVLRPRKRSTPHVSVPSALPAPRSPRGHAFTSSEAGK